MLASVGAGVVHFTAVGAHSAHTLIAGFFVAVGVLQVDWGVAVAFKRPTSALLTTGAVGNALVVMVWLMSRTVGTPAFVPGSEGREVFGVKDTACSVLELVIVAGAAVLIGWEQSDSRRPRVPMQAFAAAATAVVLLTVPGVGAPLGHATGHAGHDVAAHAGHAGHVALHAHSVHAEHVASHDAAHRHEASGHAHHPTVLAVAGPRRSDAGVFAAREGGLPARVRYGPIVLPSAGMGGTSERNIVLTNVAKPCSDCFITGARPNLVYADGSTANYDTGPMLHHAVWTRPSIDDLTCGRNSAIGSQGQRFFASGNERTPMSMPAGFGYYLGADPWNLILELMNHGQVPRTVYVTLDVTYRQASANLKRLTPVWLDVANCGDSKYSIPAGPSERTWTWTSSITGRVVAAGGHVHDGGVKTVLTNETMDQTMCTSVAGYGHKPGYEGHIESMNTCVWDRLGVLRKGQDLGLHAYYDSSEAQDDVMGIDLAFVYETQDLNGGTAPPDQSPSEQTPPPVHHH